MSKHCDAISQYFAGWTEEAMGTVMKKDPLEIYDHSQ